MIQSFSSFSQKEFTFVFGPQDPNIDDAVLRELRKTLLNKQQLQWIVKTFKEFPQEWQKLSGIPELGENQGQLSLQLLLEWVRTGSLPHDAFPLPNILVTPLVVAIQLSQYTQLLTLLNPKIQPHDKLPEALKYDTEIVGLCTGLLSAAAVASSANLNELEKNGAVAIRMAMAIGALVDAGDAGHSGGLKWQSMAVGWTSPAAESKLDTILEQFPEAYLSVISESRLATLTVLKTDAAELTNQLKNAGLIFTNTTLRGPFHCGKREEHVKSLLQLFDSDPSFQFPDASRLAFSIRDPNGSEFRVEDKLHHSASRAMLTDQADWHKLFTALHESTPKQRALVAFGSQRFLPQWFTRKLGPKLAYATNVDSESTQSAPLYALLSPSKDDAIAVVGMACHFPGGNDLDEFWGTLSAGQSQHIEVPKNRVDFEYSTWRENNTGRKWFGNFVRDHDAFDHKFFKKSPREMVSTDPQHRLMLQVAYQAVEQSGYLNAPGVSSNVGCFVGIGVADHENNVASHSATAYTATGNLKAFAAGKISHFFGWRGPSVTIDTACSSSALAVHYACKAILSSECQTAIAGGTSIMTSPEWYQNLDGASFLSPTGQCKPFDEAADGYCRGEGAGAVFLKKLSAAIEDGDQIFGVINASSVNQNENCSAITAPSVLSLSNVFNNVITKAGLSPKQISVVEAHGTGTQVGDLAEYDSVRKVLGGPSRAEPLSLGSVKGLIGHLECASGIAALIKLLLMIHNGAIPPQPSFRKLSSRLNALSSDKIEIQTQLKPWDSEFRAALLNNYGASGSNASLIVTSPKIAETPSLTALSDSRHPFWFSGIDARSLKAYASKFVHFLRSRKVTDSRFTIANLSLQLARQSNRSLGQALIFGCTTIDELEAKLSSFAAGRGELAPSIQNHSPRPVILCFGGQRSDFIGLDREAYDGFKLLRTHLDHCHEICLSLGLEGILPAIFERTPRSSIVELQIMQFALQYSCAMSWIDSGIQVAAVVGHSFGELTSLCVSGTLSVRDTLKMIAGRARAMEEKWGPDRGRMIAVDGELDTVEKLVSQTNATNPEEPAVSVACFNSSHSFTLAGTTRAIGLLIEKISATPSIKVKPLDVTHAFHSPLVDPLLSDLENLAEDLIFREPVTAHERATKNGVSGSFSKIFASHMRDPVYFDHAVQRLASQYPSSIWIEAGSASGITTMASRAVGSKGLGRMTFQSINITSSGAVQNVTDATLNLWKEGLKISFWTHVGKTSDRALLLPPYQFEKSRHWLERQKRLATDIMPTPTPTLLQGSPKGIWTFLGYKDSSKFHAQFQVNTTSEEFQEYVRAHVIVQTEPICPSMFQQVIAREALKSLVGDPNMLPELQGMESDAPLCIDESRLVWLDAERTGDEPVTWEFRITSTSVAGEANVIQHVSGRVLFRTHSDSIQAFAKYERLVDRQRALALLDGQEAEQVIQGSRNIYKAFSGIVQYNHDDYRCLQKLAASSKESAGRLAKQDGKHTILSVGLGDAFCQVAGIYLNCMTDLEDGKMYLSNRVDQWIRSPNVPADARPDRWEVYARHYQPSPKEYVSDIFVFDQADGKLVWVVLGLHFVEVSISAMSRLLSRGVKVAPSPVLPSSAVPQIPSSTTKNINYNDAVATRKTIKSASPHKPSKREPIATKAPSSDILDRVRRLFCTMLGLETDDIQLDSDLVELGIDSLLAMEVAREVEKEFTIKLELEELMDMTDVRSLVKGIHANVGASDSEATASWADQDSSEMTEESISSISQTPPDDEFEHIDKASIPRTNGGQPFTNGSMPTSGDIPTGSIVNAFTETRQLTDQFIKQSNLSGYSNHVQPRLTELVVVYTLDAFEDMGCALRTAQAGEVFPRISYPPKHNQVVKVLYGLLEKARLVDLHGDTVTRTAVPTPRKSASKLLEELLRDYPEHYYDHKLTSLTGTRLAECLTGKTEAIQLIFGSAEGRELASGMYGKSPINVAWINLLKHFWERFLAIVPQNQQEPIKILEMGAGTGGTTAGLLPLLARSGVPVCYTATDISPSLVAGLRKRFKEYPWMRFEVLDVEKNPPSALLESQHVVLATNCVHATHSLAVTTKNIHRILRPDGFLIMLEMTEEVPWVDSVFGLVEGWWLFDDGRQHALAQPDLWERTLHSNGYGHVDWTDGNLPENSIQRIIIALASGQPLSRVPIPPPLPPNPAADLGARQVLIDSLVEKHTRFFPAPIKPSSFLPTIDDSYRCVLITGATGSLGSHLVAKLAAQPDVRKVICLNRVSSSDPTTRQLEALQSRGLMHQDLLPKLEVLETNSSAAMLGLSANDYHHLVNSVTDVVHNAWAMSMTRPVRGFEPQFRTMRNLIDLCRDCASTRPSGARQVGFQFISSVSVAGCHPFHSGNAVVPEERVNADSALPMGYADAKLICEHMLDETLHRYPNDFRTASVRIGQISGSKENGYWNPVEHLIHLIKSSHTLGVLPDLHGVLSWCPVNDVAATLGDLLLGEQPAYPIYHIENPVRQPWREMITVLSDALGIPQTKVVPYREWLRLVRQFPPSLATSENPAAGLAGFFETDFLRMSCGGMILDTTRSREHSATLRSVGAIDRELVFKYVQVWKDLGFLR